MKRNIEPLGAALVAAALIVVGGTAVQIKNSISKDKNQNTQLEEYEKEQTKVFGIGEHIISMPIDDPRKEVKQYEYHEGYKPIGISTSAYGSYGNIPAQSYILYTNDYVVECHPSGKTEEELVYCDFGYPIDYEKTQSSETLDTKEFNIGEHIVSVPIDNPQDKNIQFEFYDGYEAVGMAVSSYGGFGKAYGGGCVLYVNTEPVTCEKSNEKNGVYLEFGTPIEKEMTKVKE